MKNKLEDLRNHLFAQLERLGDDSAPPSEQELARAKAVSETAKVLIDSARVEVEFLKVKSESPRLNGLSSPFLQNLKPLPPGSQSPTEPDR